MNARAILRASTMSAVLGAAGLAGGVSALGLFAAAPPDRSLEPVVELPPMIVAESSKAPPWLYVATGDTEFLSRCSPAITRAFVAAQLEIHRTLRALVPAEFLAVTAVPMVSIVVPLESMPTGDDAVFRAMLSAEDEATRRTAAKARSDGWEPPPRGRFQFLPNQRLDDRDMMAVFTFLNEREFDGQRLIVADDFLHAQLSRRTPTLPQWLIEGVVGLYRQTKMRGDPIQLQPFAWMARADTTGLQRDPESRRVLLPCGELFAPDALLGPDQRHAVRSAAWRSQTALFVRWALDPANAPARDAFWKFAARASREPTTERLFAECFGFGYSDLRDRLSDYLPIAVNEPVRLATDSLPPVPRFETKPATVAQIARLRGEWERLEIPFVREKHPQFLARYIDQARLTLQRATSRGERDPQLLAAVGLCELDAGDPVAARLALESAVAAHVTRPRVYLEVARLRWLDLARSAPATRRYTLAQLQPILDPLRVAMAQPPLLPEVFLLAMDAWLRCEEPTPPAELAKFVEAAPLFRRYSGVSLRVAFLQMYNGRRAEAATTLATGIEFVTDPETRTQYQQLQVALSTPRPDR